MLKLRIYSFEKYAHFEFDVSNKKLKKLFNAKKRLVEHLTTNQLNWQQVSITTGYKKSIEKKVNLSGVRMG